MSALNRISMAIAGLFGTGAAATPLANRNLFVDGNKDVWSATTFTLGTTPSYTSCVMCVACAGSGGAGTYAQGAWSGSPGNPTAEGMQQPLQFFGAFSQTTASTGSIAAQTGPFVGYAVENVMACEGQSFTLSVWLWCASGTVPISQIYMTQYFGTGGSPSASVITPVAVNWNVTTVPQRFSVRLDVPSIASKTLGTNNNHYTTFRIAYPVGSTFIVYDNQWQLEKSSPRSSGDLTGKGGLPTAFEYRGVGPELARVQRYYTGTPYASGINGYADVATRSITQMEYRFPVTMRAVPAISITNANLTNVTIGSIFSSTNGFNQGATAPAAGFSSYTYTVNTCDARL